MPRSLALLLVVLACDPSDDGADAADAAGEDPADAVLDDPGPPDDPHVRTEGPRAPADIAARSEARTALERALQVQAGTDEPVLAVRVAERAMMLYAEPRFGAEFRGKIPHGEAFAVFEMPASEIVEPDCRSPGWGRVGVSAWACLESTRVEDAKPRKLPGFAKGQITPFFHARVKRKDKAGNIPPAPRWASRSALAAGAEPLDGLVVDHDYAFVKRVRTSHGTLLVDKERRVVREADVRRLEPSTFAGRDVVAQPLPAGDATIAWSVTWPFATVRAEQDPESAVVARLPLQTELYVRGETVRRRGLEWIAVVGEQPGWVDADEVRRWIAAPRPAVVGEAELWIDVELEQQTLGVYVGDELLFVTMIASGNHKHATPRGLFRIYTKMAIADMDSQPEDEEQYAVEGVPWAQFFYKRYGLHGTFWHNRFGRRTSHGCVNLSAKDAALVFDMTTPHVLHGWGMSFGHAEDAGTAVRVRKLDEVDVPDRRDWRE